MQSTIKVLKEQLEHSEAEKEVMRQSRDFNNAEGQNLKALKAELQARINEMAG